MTTAEATDTKFLALLQEQIRNEFEAAQQYLAIAVYFDGADLPQLAKHFYRQSVEERNHAMMLVQYLIDRDVEVEIPGVCSVRNSFGTPRDALALALDQERTVTEQISRLAGVARDEGDYLGEQFMQWFLGEQVEEVAKMTTLVRIADRAGANLFHLEDFVARELGSPDKDAGAPKVAGGQL
ncbi:ferritin [Mycolicibacterium flavescens]|uniref:Ferritin n=1 Tax=Mycolicibacterium flavescens TaxID=1776 RepID=A0A1E3R7Y0_MYCFV|nr:ferritin [Mycolicibacterium flavescens]MCV7283085.1 ferritin [Mycolicibacterium flavescens]ODQ85861.1 bacterioferritin [Mycolicibacterium flavescens]